MSFVSKIIGTAERVPLPDLVIRAAGAPQHPAPVT